MRSPGGDHGMRPEERKALIEHRISKAIAAIANDLWEITMILWNSMWTR